MPIPLTTVKRKKHIEVPISSRTVGYNAVTVNARVQLRVAAREPAKLLTSDEKISPKK